MTELDEVDPNCGHPFDRDTAVYPVAADNGLYDAAITDRWNRLGGGPNGGYLLAVCLRALSETLPFDEPLVASIFFTRPGVVGPAQVHTEVIRSGRRVATGQARLVQEGFERARVVCTFTNLAAATGRTALFAAPPDLPAPADCLDPLAGQPIAGVTITERVEYRIPEQPGWRRGQPTGRPHTQMWIRLKDREADLTVLPLLVDAAAPAVLELGEHGSTTLQLTVHLRAHPAPGWLACRISTRFVIDGVHEEDFEVWDCQGQLVAQARQLALLTP